MTKDTLVQAVNHHTGVFQSGKTEIVTFYALKTSQALTQADSIDRVFISVRFQLTDQDYKY